MKINSKNYTEKTHAGDGTLTASEMDRRHQAFLASQPMITRCGFCDWTYEGLAGGARAAWEEHQADAHPRAHVKSREELHADRMRIAEQRAADAVASENREQTGLADPPRLSTTSRRSKLAVSGAQPESADLQELPEPEAAPDPGATGEASTTPDRSGATAESETRMARESWTEERAVEAIKAFFREHARTPKAAEMRASSGLPSIAGLKAIGLSYADLIEKAGFDRPARGGRGGRSQEKPATRRSPATAKRDRIDILRDLVTAHEELLEQSAVIRARIERLDQELEAA